MNLRILLESILLLCVIIVIAFIGMFILILPMILGGFGLIAEELVTPIFTWWIIGLFLTVCVIVLYQEKIKYVRD